MATRTDEPDVLEVLASMKPDLVALDRAWPDSQRQAVIHHALSAPSTQSWRARSRWIGVGVAVAAVSTAALLLVPGAINLNRPIPAIPVQTPTTQPSPGRVVVGPASEVPSASVVVLDDPELVDRGSPNDVLAPGVYFVDGDTTYLADRRGQILTYRDGRRTAAVASPVTPVRGLVVLDGVFYLLSDTLHAFTRQGDDWTEVDTIPARLAESIYIQRLVVEDGNLVAAQWPGQRDLAAGPGPLPAAPEVAETEGGWLVVDGAVEVEIPVAENPPAIQRGGEPVVLARDAGHVWYLVNDTRYDHSEGTVTYNYVFEFFDGRPVATYTWLPGATRPGCSSAPAVFGGKVYQQVCTDQTVQLLQLAPTQ